MTQPMPNDWQFLPSLASVYYKRRYPLRYIVSALSFFLFLSLYKSKPSVFSLSFKFHLSLSLSPCVPSFMFSLTLWVYLQSWYTHLKRTEKKRIKICKIQTLVWWDSRTKLEKVNDYKISNLENQHKWCQTAKALWWPKLHQVRPFTISFAFNTHELD